MDPFTDYSLPYAYSCPGTKAKKPNNQHYQPFKVNDVVRLKSGSSPIVVSRVFPSRGTLVGEYIKSGTPVDGPYSKFTYYKENETQQNGDYEMTDVKTIYEVTVDDKTLYANKLAVDSLGRWVMQVIGSSDIVAVDKKDTSEVLPYTISVRFSSDGQVYNYLNTDRDITTGFYITAANSSTGFTIVQVTALDTKSKAATKEFAPLGKISVA